MNRSLSCVFALAGTLAISACGDMTTGPTDPTDPGTVDNEVTQAAGAIALPIDRIDLKPPLLPLEHRIVGDGRIDDPIADTPALGDDAQVLHVLFTLHGGEMALIEEVLPRLRSTQARDLAHMMHDDHRGALRELRALVDDKDVVLEPSDVSLGLRRRSLAAREELLSAPGRDVDEMFIEQQVAVHTKALVLIDEALAPAAQKEDVKKLVAVTRDLVVKHHQLASRLHLIASEGGLRDGAPM